MRYKTGEQVCSTKTRWLFWLAFGACYLLVIFISLKVVRPERFMGEGILRVLIHGFSLLISLMVIPPLCQSVGLNLHSKVKSAFGVDTSPTSGTCSELRTYTTQITLRIGAAAFVGVAMLNFFLHFRIDSPLPFWRPLITIALGGLFWLASYLGRHGDFVARADENGVEIQNSINPNKPSNLKWAEIGSVVRVETSTIMGIQAHLEFRDAMGQWQGKIVLKHVPQAQQQEFSQVVARYLSPSVVA